MGCGLSTFRAAAELAELFEKLGFGGLASAPASVTTMPFLRNEKTETPEGAAVEAAGTTRIDPVCI